MKKIGDTVYWERIDGTIDSGEIVAIDKLSDPVYYDIISDDIIYGLEDHSCLPEDDPRVQKYIQKENEGLWIARDLSGALVCHLRKPDLLIDCWHSVYMVPINRELYSEVTFENSPKKLRI